MLAFLNWRFEQMNTARAIELGYASRAILSALMEELVSSKVLSPSAALDKAVANIQGAGSLVWVKGATAVVADVRRDLAPLGVR